MANPREEFLQAALWHGELAEAEGILEAHPELEGLAFMSPPCWVTTAPFADCSRRIPPPSA